MWRLWRNVVPVKKNLKAKIESFDPTCPFCGKEEEMVEHEFLFRKEVIHLWFASQISGRMECYQNMSFV